MTKQVDLEQLREALEYEVGWCVKHEDLAKRWGDGSWGCWWEDVVEVNGYHVDQDFVPLRLVADGEVIPLADIGFEAALNVLIEEDHNNAIGLTMTGVRRAIAAALHLEGTE